MQSFCNITGQQPRRPVRRHLIGIEWVKTPIHEEMEVELLTLESCRAFWSLASLGEISSSPSWLPVVVTYCNLLLPDFFLENAGRCLWIISHCCDRRGGGSGSWENPWLLIWWCNVKSDINFSGSPRILFKNWTILNSTCLCDSPDGAQKSGWKFSIKLRTSGVYISERGAPLPMPQTHLYKSIWWLYLFFCKIYFLHHFIRRQFVQLNNASKDA